MDIHKDTLDSPLKDYITLKQASINLGVPERSLAYYCESHGIALGSIGPNRMVPVEKLAQLLAKSGNTGIKKAATAATNQKEQAVGLEQMFNDFVKEALARGYSLSDASEIFTRFKMEAEEAHAIAKHEASVKQERKEGM